MLKLSLLPSIIACTGLLLGFSGCQCLQKVQVMKGQRFYAYDYTAADTSALAVNTGTLKVYKSTKAFSATFREDGDAVYIKADNTSGISEVGNVTFPKSAAYVVPVGRSTSIKPKFYFSATEASFPDEPQSTFGYKQWKLYLQGMAIPLKFRRSLDSVRAQAEAGPTLALAPGLKHSWNWYSGNKNLLGFNTTSISAAFGGLVGVGVVDIKSSSTKGKVPDNEATKNAIVPVGLHFVVGINNINIGAAMGWDIITGPNRAAWNYKGQMWTGLIIGLDILK